MTSRTPPRSSEAPRFQLKVTLRYSAPPVCRRVVVPSSITLDRLHRVIQALMPWTDSHLHQFIRGKERYVMSPQSERELSFGPLPFGEKKFALSDVVGIGEKLVYEYDFGDSWEHEIKVEKELPPDPAVRHPVCLDGANACPPDDCGGIPGYDHLLEVLANPNDEEHEEMKEWIGGSWDPARFDLEETNARLKRIRLP